MNIKVDKNHPDEIALRIEEDRLRLLQSDKAKKERELARLTQLYMTQKRSNKQALIDAEADRLLGSTSTLPTVDNDLKDIEAIEHRIAVLKVAIDKQRTKVDHVRGQFSVHLCEINKNLYVEIERRIAAAVKALASANQEEADFFNALRDEGCSSISFRPMRLSQVGLANDQQSVAAFHQQEMRKYCPEALQ
jgi:adenine-specific DNA glycosylase